MFRTRGLTFLGVFAALVVGSPAKAATKNWNANVENGNWSTPGNWSPSGVPANGDDVNITLAVLLAKFTINYDSTTSGIGLNSLTLSDIGAGGSNLTVNMSGSADLLYTNYEYLAVSNANAQNATFNQSDGQNTTSIMYVGYGQNGTGTYNLKGGTLNINNILYVGYNGVGNFNQSGGSQVITNNNAAGNLYVGGISSSSSGIYTLSGGTLFCDFEDIVPQGTFQQSAGENDNGEIGVDGGTYTMTGGTMLVDDVFDELNSLVVGSRTTGGMFNHSGGTVGSADYPVKIEMGVRGGSSGTYTLSGTGQIVANEEDIGEIGSGTFNQIGGTNSITGALLVGVDGNDFTTTGSYNLSGGLLTVSGHEDIGESDSPTAASFVQTGGTHTVTGALTIASGGVGTFSLSGGSVSAQNVVVGANSNGMNIPGVLTVSGTGTLTVSNTLSVVYAPDTSLGTTSLNLNGGMITTNQLDLGGHPELFHWTSGTLKLVSTVIFDPGSPATPTAAAFGSELYLTNGKTLDETRDETLGNNSFFYLEVDSGGAHIVGGELTINPLGELVVNGGAVTAGTLNNIGMLTVGSGTITGDSVTLNSNGDVDFYLANTTRGTGYGVLASTGNLSIDGELHVYLNGLTPAAGQRFDLLDWNTHSGKFNFISLPSLSSGLTWSTLQIYGTGVLEVVSSSYLPGDFNRDGHVNSADIIAMEQALVNLTGYQSAKGLTAAQLLAIGDINGDGVVTNADLQMLLNALKAGGGSSDPVPEPTSLTIAAIGIVLFGAARRTRQTRHRSHE